MASRRDVGNAKWGCYNAVMHWTSKDSNGCHDLAKWLSHYLYFLFFSFLLSWTYYIEGSAGKCHITSGTSHKSHHMMSHDGSHDKCGKVVHRPYSSCISSVENIMGTLLSSLCQLLNKEQVGFIPAWSLATLQWVISL